jgi:hypothetical protein
MGKVIVGLSRLNSNGSLDSSFNPGTGANGAVRSIALQSDGNILLGGDFTAVNDVQRPYVARLYGADVPPSLSVARSNALVKITWPSSATGFVLDQSLTTTGGWSQVAFPYATNASGIHVSVPAATGNKFYRLRKP